MSSDVEAQTDVVHSIWRRDDGQGAADVLIGSNPSAFESEPVNILVVDDVEDNLLATKAILERPSIVVLSATSAAGAQELLRTNDVALALLDVQMPEVNGFALAELMRSTERTRSVPIIFLTGNRIDPARTFRGYEAGAVDFLFKPVDPRVLESKVRVFVELYEQRRQLHQRNAVLERLLEINEKLAAKLRQDHGEAVQEALTDALTGVPNRRHILQLAETALADRRKQSQPLSLAILDLDHFKAINDTHGHSAGDAVLHAFCQHVRARMRSPSVLGRVGGEEFLLLMPGTVLEDACYVLERVRRTLQPHAGAAYTFSAGLAQARPGESLSQLMDGADQALYRAKRSGRNCSMTRLL
ncbi:GGDEF domain-containing response regulator [Piscinibacter sp.]|uniref:GGDEF domain-containing response regulator n=1 Tax=Piscinibacter sp. TaxID=1903157 RepID=UPI002B68E425|nr:diguanylate cyclase [Albitalea sp.]HUG24772.1 diguanylate cyclase [Albitalea sp.]